MELIGDEKRIPALFSEARLADEQSAPGFAGVWNRAQSQTFRPRKAFNLAFVAATALLVCALVSLAWWSTRWQQKPVAIATVPTSAPALSPVSNPVNQPKVEPLKNTVRPATLRPRSPVIKLGSRSEDPMVAANQKATRDAKAIASWQSPTSTLLDSPNDGLLKSLPQMNQTVDEMKSFLPSQPK
jgi:hypothetical protein